MKSELEKLAKQALETAMDKIAEDILLRNKEWLEKEILKIIKNNRDLRSLIKSRINSYINDTL